jgi:hypothetical protein
MAVAEHETAGCRIGAIVDELLGRARHAKGATRRGRAPVFVVVSQPPHPCCPGILAMGTDYGSGVNDALHAHDPTIAHQRRLQGRPGEAPGTDLQSLKGSADQLRLCLTPQINHSFYRYL